MPIVIERVGSSTVDDRQRARVVGVGDRLADRHLGQAGDRDDLARARLVGRNAVERLGDVELGDARVLDRAVGAAPGDLLRLCVSVPWRTRQSARRPTYGEASRFVTSACSGCSGSYDGGGNGVEQRLERAASGRRRARRARGRPSRRARSRRRSGTRSALVGVEVEEELVDLVARPPRRARRARSILLTTSTTGRRASSALRSTKRVCGSGPSLASTSSSTPSTIVRPALDLAAEVGVAGRVDDVDLHAADADRGVLGEDRDALLALEVGRVHDALVDVLVLAERCRTARASRRRASSCRGRRGRRSRRCAGRRGGR